MGWTLPSQSNDLYLINQPITPIHWADLVVLPNVGCSGGGCAKDGAGLWLFPISAGLINCMRA